MGRGGKACTPKSVLNIFFSSCLNSEAVVAAVEVILDQIYAQATPEESTQQ
jgi:hypothetical protein